ncbi:hypothetical protein M0Q03_02165 [bacterium]|jgi:hypothetical protein|nr:hypothetical protein [bacterium]
MPTSGTPPRGGAGFSSKANKENPKMRKMAVPHANHSSAHKKMKARRAAR